MTHSRFREVRRRLEGFDPGTGWRLWLYEFLLFGFKQAWACVSGALMLVLLQAKISFVLVSLVSPIRSKDVTARNAMARTRPHA